MKIENLSQRIITQINSWKGYETFDGTYIDFRSQDPEIFENYQGTVLMEAVERGAENIVQNLIRAGADVNAVKNATQQSPLLCLRDALWKAESENKLRKDVEISKKLIKAGANVNYIARHDELDEEDYESFNTPLLDACMNGRLELVKLLIKSGADVNLSRNDGLNAICMLERDSENYVSILNELIDAGANVDVYGGTAIQGAIAESNIEAIKLLLNSGANLDIQSTDEFLNGRTPFMSLLNGNAVDLGEDEEQEIFFSFLQKIGNVNIIDLDGKSLLSYAIDTYIGSDEFGLLVFDKILYNESIDINQTDNNGNTVLTSLLLSMEEEGFATYEFYDDERYKIESLLISGANIDILNHKEESPMIVSNRIGNKKIIDLLENRDGLINVENHMGRTPLFVACLQGHIEKVNWLINKGAYLNAKNTCSKIPRGIDLHGTFIQTHDGTVKQKLFTALMASQNLETIRALILAGADINQKDSDGNTALMLFAKDDWQEGVSELLKAGADTSSGNGCLKGIISKLLP